MDNIDNKSVKKIGSIPSGYSEEDMVYIENGKIFIAKKEVKQKTKKNNNKN